MKVVLAGNPNAGKTTLFNKLTKSRLATGNWHGVTTRPAYKTVRGVTYADVPGMYSFGGYSMEEGCAAEEIRSADIVVNVIDGLTLENSLSLTRAITALNKRTVIYVTKLKELERRGGGLCAEQLSRLLGVPVFTRAEELQKYLSAAGRGGHRDARSAPLRRVQKNALNAAYHAGDCALTRAEKVFYNRGFALFLFLFFIVLMFFLAFFPGMPGEALKGLCERLISSGLRSAAESALPAGKVRSLVCDGIIGGAGGVLSFVPQLAILYLFLTLLDESGVMSALSFVTDGIFAKAKLSGRAAFSLVSGFGCTAAAILTTRGFTSKDTQRRAIAALAYIPCGAKMPVFLTLLSPLFKDPFPVITVLYFAGMALSLAVCFIVKGREEELLSEVAPVALPSPAAVLKKLYFYIKGFIIKVATVVLLFCVASWALSNFTFGLAPCGLDESMLADISRLLTPLFAPAGLGDWRLAYAMISGFAAKENVAATINMLMPGGAGLDTAGAFSACVFVLACPACVSAFAASCKEAGVKVSLALFAFQLATCFIAAYIVHFLFSL